MESATGSVSGIGKKGIAATGTQLFGGGTVTAGGLIFIGASKDEKFRAIDKLNGKTLWEYQLPAGGYATPATYEVDGKQYVVIAAGGGGFQRTKTGDCYMAFALP
jgi:quinoprotein glucose dehydrogenase